MKISTQKWIQQPISKKTFFDFSVGPILRFLFGIKSNERLCSPSTPRLMNKNIFITTISATH